MAKTAFSQWDTTAANNTDINSIPIDGASMLANQVDDAIRELMAQLAGAGFVTTGTDLTISKATPAINLKKTATAQFATINYMNISENRWVVGMDSTAEGGSNAGSDYFINRYDDDGVFLGTALTIYRSSGLITAGGAAEVTLTDAATIAVNMRTFMNAKVTLGGNRTLGQPSNTSVGQCGFIRIIQDGTGSRTLGYHSDWKFEAGADPVLSTAAGATDLLFYQVIAGNFIYATLVRGVA